MERNIIQEKRDYLKLFFNFILSEADLNTCGMKPLEGNQATVGLKIKASVAKEEWNSILHREQQTTESLLSNDKNFPEWKKVQSPSLAKKVVFFPLKKKENKKIMILTIPSRHTKFDITLQNQSDATTLYGYMEVVATSRKPRS